MLSVDIKLPQSERLGLEAVLHAGNDLSHGGVGVVDRVFEPSGAAVDGRTLAESVFVAAADRPARNFLVGAVAVGVHVAGHTVGRAAEDGELRAEDDAVAVDVAVADTAHAVGEFNAEVFVAQAAADPVGVLEVLRGEVGGGEAAVVVGAEREGHLILAADAVETGGHNTFVRVVEGTDEAEAADLVGGGDGGVAVGGGLAFFAGGFNARDGVRQLGGVVGLEGVLSVDLGTVEVGRFVDDGVVNAAGVRREDEVLVADDRAPAAAHRGEVGEDAVRAVVAHERAHAAEGERTEVGLEEEAGFAAEEAVVVAELAVVGGEAVFELEADHHAVAEFFNALEAELGSGVVAGVERERRVAHVLVTGVVVAGDRGHAETDVDGTVEGNRSGRSGARDGTEESQSKKRLLHNKNLPNFKRVCSFPCGPSPRSYARPIFERVGGKKRCFIANVRRFRPAPLVP